MGSKVSHVEEEKQNLLEEVVGEKNTHAVKGGEREKLVCVSGTPLQPRHTSQHLSACLGVTGDGWKMLLPALALAGLGSVPWLMGLRCPQVRFAFVSLPSLSSTATRLKKKCKYLDLFITPKLVIPTTDV